MGDATAMLRDEKGGFVAAQCKYIDYASDASTTEALKMCGGLSLAKSLGYNQVEGESDSQMVVDFQHQAIKMVG